MQHEYLFRSGIHACAVGGDYVLLDTALDRYLFLSGAQAVWFADIAAAPKVALTGPAGHFAERLCTRDILTRCQNLGQPIQLTPTHNAHASTCDLDADRNIRPSLRHAATLLALWAAWGHGRRARGLPLAATLSAAHQWKQAARAKASGTDARAADLARCFHALTPYFFSIHDACFFRSLLLLRFLAHFGIDADWIFGVRTSPFVAHCWVSRNGIVLNEALDTCADYQTIMVI